MMQERVALNRVAAATSLMAVACLLLTQGSAVAHEGPPGKYRMTVISDEAYGHKIIAGHYAEAVDRIDASRGNGSKRFFAYTNLCVAFTLTGEVENARPACDEALALIDTDSSRLPKFFEPIQTDYESMALSNRGVLRAVSGDVDGARDDFLAAEALGAGLSAPAENLARLNAVALRSAAVVQDGH